MLLGVDDDLGSTCSSTRSSPEGRHDQDMTHFGSMKVKIYSEALTIYPGRVLGFSDNQQKRSSRCSNFLVQLSVTPTSSKLGLR